MGTFIFVHPPAYGWYLSVTAIPLNTSWWLHNVIAWIKIKPFLSRKWSMVFIISVVASIPYWIVEIYANFTFFNNINEIFLKTRPYESIFRYARDPSFQVLKAYLFCSDPWWIFTTAFLFWQIATNYRIKLTNLVVISPRFGVLLVAMMLSICFIVLDILSVTHVFDSALPDGLNPFWKLSTVFKCLTDSIVLDDFKTALDRLMRHKMRREGFGQQQGLDFGTVSSSQAQPSVQSPNSYSAAYNNWGFASDREAARGEDPLGEESMERRVTQDAEKEARFQADFEKAKLDASQRTESDDLEKELAACGASPARPLHDRPIRPIGHPNNHDEGDLPSMLTETSKKRAA